MKQDNIPIAKAIRTSNRVHYLEDMSAIMQNHTCRIGADPVPEDTIKRLTQITNVYLRESNLRVDADQFVVWLDVNELLDTVRRLHPNE
jgi:hypothetical protein